MRGQRCPVGLARKHATQHVIQVRMDVQIVAHRTADYRHQVRCSLASSQGPFEQPVLAAGRHALHQLLAVVVVDRDACGGGGEAT